MLGLHIILHHSKIKKRQPSNQHTHTFTHTLTHAPPFDSTIVSLIVSLIPRSLIHIKNVQEHHVHCPCAAKCKRRRFDEKNLAVVEKWRTFSLDTQTGDPFLAELGHLKTCGLMGWFLKRFLRVVGGLIFSRNV